MQISSKYNEIYRSEVIERLCDDHGYCPICANELLKYVGTLLNR